MYVLHYKLNHKTIYISNTNQKGIIMEKKIILTGDRPTGKLHIGHYIGSLKSRVELQNSNSYDEMYILIADAQALTDNSRNVVKVKSNIIEVMLDYLAVGLDPNKVIFALQSQIPELTELTFYYMNLVTLARLERNPTVKEELKLRNFQNTIPVGFLTYPISQAADITAFEANIVPVGEDQMPMIEQTREIVRTFNSCYAPVLVEPKEILPQNEVCRRLPGTDGNGKMSKSLDNCIYLSDEDDEINRKVMSMYTDPNHIKVSDPGRVEGNVVFTYLEAFSCNADFEKYLPEYKNLEELKDHYRRGGLGDVKIKKFLYKILVDLITPIRNRRKELQNHIPEILNNLNLSTQKARAKALNTVNKVKKAMDIDYFGDNEFIKMSNNKYNK